MVVQLGLWEASQFSDKGEQALNLQDNLPATASCPLLCSGRSRQMLTQFSSSPPKEWPSESQTFHPNLASRLSQSYLKRARVLAATLADLACDLLLSPSCSARMICYPRSVMSLLCNDLTPRRSRNWVPGSQDAGATSAQFLLN